MSFKELKNQSKWNNTKHPEMYGKNQKDRKEEITKKKKEKHKEKEKKMKSKHFTSSSYKLGTLCGSNLSYSCFLKR